MCTLWRLTEDDSWLGDVVRSVLRHLAWIRADLCATIIGIVEATEICGTLWNRENDGFRSQAISMATVNPHDFFFACFRHQYVTFEWGKNVARRGTEDLLVCALLALMAGQWQDRRPFQVPGFGLPTRS